SRMLRRDSDIACTLDSVAGMPRYCSSTLALTPIEWSGLRISCARPPARCASTANRPASSRCVSTLRSVERSRIRTSRASPPGRDGDRTAGTLPPPRRAAVPPQLLLEGLEPPLAFPPQPQLRVAGEHLLQPLPLPVPRLLGAQPFLRRRVDEDTERRL